MTLLHSWPGKEGDASKQLAHHQYFHCSACLCCPLMTAIAMMPLVTSIRMCCLVVGQVVAAACQTSMLYTKAEAWNAV